MALHCHATSYHIGLQLNKDSGIWLARWGHNKTVNILLTVFSCEYFIELFCIEVCSWVHDQQHVSIGSGNGLAPSRWHAIVWISDDRILQCQMASLGYTELTQKQRQNGRHFADDVFKYIFLNGNLWISIKISLKFVPKGPINNIPALVQIMAWRQTGDKPLSEPMIVYLSDAYMGHSASMT